jgi:hypothetical protein
MISFVPDLTVFASLTVPRFASKIFRHWAVDP